MPQPPAPFALTYSPQFPELLHQLGASIALTTYQAGKLVLLSAPTPEGLTQLPRTFAKPMGIGYDPARGRLALACRHEVITFANSPALARHYPKSPGKYDALFMPRITYHTGALDIHDLRFGLRQNQRDAPRREASAPAAGEDTLYAVNTRFNCLVTLDGDYNFTPYWSPPQIDRVAADDRCHLNGMAMLAGRPKYATAFGTGNAAGAWRDTLLESGVLYDVDTGDVLAGGLAMPHSPRLFGDELYVLLSATGQLARVDRDGGGATVVAEVGGFVRGMDRIGDYVFVATSKLRKNSSTFAKLDLPGGADRAGLVAIHLPTGARVAELTYRASVDEIYDVHALPGLRRPNVLNTIKDDHRGGVMIPTTTFWARPTDAPAG